MRDVVLAAGDTFTVDRDGLTLVEAQEKSTVCVLALHAVEVRRGARPPLARRIAAWLASVGAADTTAAPRRTTDAMPHVHVAEFSPSGRGRAGDAMYQVTPLVEIALGTLPLIVSLFLHGIGMNIVQRVFETRAIPQYRAKGHAHVYFAAMIVVMLITHLVEIFMWSAALVGIEAIAVFRDAFYYVAGTYTTLGYGEGTLPREWRLLAPMIAISGLFAFGWTTGVLINLVAQATRLNRRGWRRRCETDRPAQPDGARRAVSSSRT